MTTIRVFPRRTRATPTDDLVRVGVGPGLWDEADAVHISVAFTWDLPEADRLEREWRHVAPVTIGGPAVGTRGEEFMPGRYIRHGYTITSRGCPNTCWFCSVWRRDGTVRELPIHPGWNVLDDNLLACSDDHVEAVFAMLRQQHQPIEFTGGLEAARMTRRHVELLTGIRLKQLFCAYDTPDDLPPLIEAGIMLREAGITAASHKARCYVLCGWPKDTMGDADRRMGETANAGFMPMAMLWRGQDGSTDREWRTFQREWARPHIVAARMAAHP